MNKNNNSCNNCGRPGHLYHQCKLPITSYGVILFRPSDLGPEYLMIRRKDSFGYIDFIRGKYSTSNIHQIQQSINEMSVEEKQRLLTCSFDSLWIKMWGETSNFQYRSEEMSSRKKFEMLLNTGVLRDLVEKSNTCWKETEWEFPKGRRDHKERDIDCALREFEEETGIKSSNITIIENVMPFEETFIGTNHKSYKHKYFLAKINDNIDKDCMTRFQPTEVSKMEWKYVEECLESMRPYNLEKKRVITDIDCVLNNNRLYCCN